MHGFNEKESVGRMVDNPFISEWLEDIEQGDSSSPTYLACVKECIRVSESRNFEERRNNDVKLDIYVRFGKSIEFKKCLHGICDVGLLFKFRSDIYVWSNEELSRHIRKDNKIK